MKMIKYGIKGRKNSVPFLFLTNFHPLQWASLTLRVALVYVCVSLNAYLCACAQTEELCICGLCM